MTVQTNAASLTKRTRSRTAAVRLPHSASTLGYLTSSHPYQNPRIDLQERRLARSDRHPRSNETAAKAIHSYVTLNILLLPGSRFSECTRPDTRIS